MSENRYGNVHSIQTLGAVDGPGVRFVVFMQGCPLRCVCCHNPDTWSVGGGQQIGAAELADRAARYQEYFGNNGGVTVSGGEPLLQAAFVAEFFRECHDRGLHTCLDTSGCVMNDDVRALLQYTDLVLLDIKYTDADKYQRYVGCDIQEPLSFLAYLQSINKPVWLRQVIIPDLNDDEENVRRLADLASDYPCVQRTELLPFRKLCSVKYDAMSIPFALADTPEPTAACMQQLNQLLCSKKRHP